MALVSPVAGAHSSAISVRGKTSREVDSDTPCSSSDVGFFSSLGARRHFSVSKLSLLLNSSRKSPHASFLLAGFESSRWTNGSRESFRVRATISKTLRISSSLPLLLKDSEPDTTGGVQGASPNRRHNDPLSNFEIGKTPSGGQETLSLAEQLRSQSLDIAQIPPFVGSKREVSDNRVGEIWAPAGLKRNLVKQILDRLEGVEETFEAVLAAMDGWDSSISARDTVAVLSSLKWNKALPFFKWAKAEGHEINLIVHNVLLGTFRRGKVWRVADEFAQQMIASGVVLDNYSYSTLISCALQCDAPEDSLRWFGRMHEAGCVPDEVTLGSMALVYSKLGRYEDSLQLYEKLKKTGWKPDKVSYGTMVNVYSSAGKYHKAAAVIREMQDQGIKLEAVVYNTLIKCYAREGKSGQAKRVFQDMEDAGVKPNEYSLTLMIEVYGRAGEIREAFSAFSRIKEGRLPLDVVVYNSLLKMCAEERLMTEAENILAGMVGRGLKPDSTTYKCIINIYAKEGKIKDAEKYANRMVEVGLSLDVVVYSCLVKACGNARNFKKVETFFGKMLAEGIEADDKFCGVLLGLLNLCETEEDKAIVLGCLQRSKPTLRGMVDLISGDDLQVSDLEEKLRTLLAESYPDSHRPFCNSLIDICWSSERKDRARQLLTLAESLDVYPGGLWIESKQFWILHLRSLSFNTAECALFSWIDYLREQVKLSKELPETLVLETGVGRNRDDEVRLYNVIQSKMKNMGSPFEPSPERQDWMVATGRAMVKWLLAPPVVQSDETCASGREYSLQEFKSQPDVSATLNRMPPKVSLGSKRVLPKLSYLARKNNSLRPPPVSQPRSSVLESWGLSVSEPRFPATESWTTPAPPRSRGSGTWSPLRSQSRVSGSEPRSSHVSQSRSPSLRPPISVDPLNQNLGPLHQR